MKYHPTTVTLSTFQVESLIRSIEGIRPLTLRIPFKKMSSKRLTVVLPFTTTQKRRIERNRGKDKGAEITLSRAQLRAIKAGGGLLDTLRHFAGSVVETGRRAGRAVAQAGRTVGEAAQRFGISTLSELQDIGRGMVDNAVPIFKKSVSAAVHTAVDTVKETGATVLQDPAKFKAFVLTVSAAGRTKGPAGAAAAAANFLGPIAASAAKTAAIRNFKSEFVGAGHMKKKRGGAVVLRKAPLTDV